MPLHNQLHQYLQRTLRIHRQQRPKPTQQTRLPTQITQSQYQLPSPSLTNTPHHNKARNTSIRRRQRQKQTNTTKTFTTPTPNTSQNQTSTAISNTQLQKPQLLRTQRRPHPLRQSTHLLQHTRQYKSQHKNQTNHNNSSSFTIGQNKTRHNLPHSTNTQHKSTIRTPRPKGDYSTQL